MRVFSGISVVALFALLGFTAPSAESQPRSTPDLAMTAVAVPPGATTVIAVRDTVAVRGRVARVTVGYFLSRDRNRTRDDIRLGGVRVVTAKTRTGTARVRVPARAPRASFYVLACADVANRVSEGNERNNCRGSSSRLTLLAPFRPSPLHVRETLEGARSTDAALGPAGGSLAATAADGTRFVLRVPARALSETRRITMTPLAAITGLPGGSRPAGAVRFEPAGLELARAAVLTVSPAAALPVGRQLAFATAAGRDFHAYPMLRDRAVRLPITHFSTFGVIRLGPSATEIVFRRQPSTRVAWAEQTLARALRDARARGAGAEAYESAAYAAFYVIGNEHVRPMIAAAKDRVSRRAALRAYVSWRRQLELLLGEGSYERLEKLLGELTDDVRKMLGSLVEDALRRCESGADPFAAREALALARQLQLWGMDVQAEARVAGCLRFELTMTSSASWTVDDFAQASASVSAVNIPLGTGAASVAPLQASIWNVIIVGELAEFCVPSSASYIFDQPLFAVAEVGFVPENDEEIRVADLYVDVRPGSDKLAFGMTCSAGQEPIVIEPPGGGGLYRTVFETSHAAEKVGKEGTYRIRGWQRLTGAAWAAEARFDRSRDEGTWSWTETTRFFLRHAPLRN